MAKRRPSAAAMKRRVAELNEQSASPTPLPPAAAEFVERYRLKGCNDDEWSQVGPVLRELLGRAGYVSKESIKNHCHTAGSYLLWRFQNGLTLTVTDVMTHEAIDAYIAAIGDRYVGRTANDYRSRLHSLASRTNPGIAAPTCTTPGYVTVTPGYTATEEAIIRRTAERQRNAGARRSLCAVVGFCGGAGLTSQELSHTPVGMVDDRGDEHGIFVNIGGERPRTVVVRRDYERLVRIAIEGRTPGQPLLGRVVGRGGISSDAVEKAEVFDDCPRIDGRRLRTTWITWLATRAVPLNVLMAASGLTSARTLTDIVAALPKVDATEHLRGGAS